MEPPEIRVVPTVDGSLTTITDDAANALPPFLTVSPVVFPAPSSPPVRTLGFSSRHGTSTALAQQTDPKLAPFTRGGRTGERVSAR